MLLKTENLCLSYGNHILVDHANFSIFSGDRLCLVGRNGAGKSSLLKCLAGENEYESGHVWMKQGARLGYLTQDLPEVKECTVFDFVAEGLDQLGKDLSRFNDLTQDHSAQNLVELERVQERIEALDGWNFQNRITRVITRLELNANNYMNSLSGGQRRRAALARALVMDPDILLLDEPTNHLDVSSIEWLEQELQNFAGAVLFVTHDRAFLENVATKIGQLDRGNFSLFEGKYSAYLAFREKKLEEEERHNAEFDKRLAQEEAWIRQGIKARRTRNEGRVRALKKLRNERQARRERQGVVKLSGIETSTSGKLVAELNKVSFAWPEQAPVVKRLSTVVMRGDKIGLIGPNGIGKTTFLKILLGQIEPSEGSVKLGTKLDIGFFDQLRDQLILEKSAVENIAQGRDFIDINGSSRHALSYLGDFLFSPERARLPVKALSGGERNRVLLAKLLSHPTNLLVLDEPTNDLDMETLELLEERLTEYQGTVLLVSHDRQFIDNVVTSTLSFEGKGCIKEYVGGYYDWVRQGGLWYKPDDTQDGGQADDGPTNECEQNSASSIKAGSVKLSYKLQRELDALPEKIERYETEIETLQSQMNENGFYQQEHALVQKVVQQMEAMTGDLQQAYDRWEELESMKESQ